MSLSRLKRNDKRAAMKIINIKFFTKLLFKLILQFLLYISILLVFDSVLPFGLFGNCLPELARTIMV